MITKNPSKVAHARARMWVRGGGATIMKINDLTLLN